jgi:hypothetical protein
VNQQSTIPFGTDATLLAGYAMNAANDRLGNFDLVIENTGANSLYLRVKEQTLPQSGFSDVGSPITVVPKGTVTRSYSILSKRIGFFGSGNTIANISPVLRNKGDLRGAQIDIVQIGRRGWSWDNAFDQKSFKSPGWGTQPDTGAAEV